MRRTLAVAAVAAVSLFASTGVALAGDPAPDQELPPAFVPPTPAPVVDDATAAAFAERYAARNAPRFLNQDRRRVRVVDTNAACLEHPIIADRFGCVFTVRALVAFRNRGWDGWDDHNKATPASTRGGDHGRRHHRRFRIRTYGCLGALTVVGGPTVTPSGILRFVECARAPRGDYVAPEPVL